MQLRRELVQPTSPGVVDLVACVDREIRSSSKWQAWAGVLGVATSTIIAVEAARLHDGIVTAVALAFGIVSLAAAIFAVGRPRSLAARAVRAALVDDPTRLTDLRRSLRDREQITIATAAGRIAFVTRDAELFGELRRRCPDARL